MATVPIAPTVKKGVNGDNYTFGWSLVNSITTVQSWTEFHETLNVPPGDIFLFMRSKFNENKFYVTTINVTCDHITQKCLLTFIEVKKGRLGCILKYVSTGKKSASCTLSYVKTVKKSGGRQPADDEPTTPGIDGVPNDYSYVYTDTRKDFNGTTFEASPAPVLPKNTTRTKPRETGNSIVWKPGKTINTVLLRRLPPHGTTKKVIVYAGPNFTDNADKLAVMSRGYNYIAENTPNKADISTNGVYLIGNFRDSAKATANGNRNNNDPSVQDALKWLDDYGNNEYFMDNEKACRLFGASIWLTFQQADWSNFKGAYGVCPDFENGRVNPRSGNPGEVQWANMVGWVMYGIRDAALKDNKTPPLFFGYDYGNLSSYSPDTQPQPANGIYYNKSGQQFQITETDPQLPMFYHRSQVMYPFNGGTSKSEPIGANTPLARYVKAYGGAIGSVEYMRKTWPVGQSYFQKNADGTYKTQVVKGVTCLVWRTDPFHATVNGQDVPILGPSPSHWLTESYEHVWYQHHRLASAFSDWYFRSGGVVLPTNTMRQVGWEKLLLQQWFRYDTEQKDGSENNTDPKTGQPYDAGALNNRPLNPEFAVNDTKTQYHLRDVLRFWMEPMPTLDQGKQSAKNVARSSIEDNGLGMYQAMEFDWLADVTAQLFFNRFPLFKQDTDAGFYDPNEALERKPLVWGWFVPSRNGKVYWFINWLYAAQEDSDLRPLYAWLKLDNGDTSPAYKFSFWGRKVCTEAFEVDAKFVGAKPQNMRFRYKDMVDSREHTDTGDPRVSGSTSETMPALYKG